MIPTNVPEKKSDVKAGASKGWFRAGLVRALGAYGTRTHQLHSTVDKIDSALRR